MPYITRIEGTRIKGISFTLQNFNPSILISLILFVMLLLPSLSSGDIFKYVDEQGVIHFSNVPTEDKFKKVYPESSKKINSAVNTQRLGIKSSKIAATIPKSQTQITDTAFSEVIHNTSERYGIDPALVKAVIRAESNFNPYAVSQKGAQGLMQLMPRTSYELNVYNAFNPEENIDGGVRYLKYLLSQFNGNLPLSLAAYNAGPERVQQWKNIPPIKETQDYVRKVLGIYRGSGLMATERKERIYKIIQKDGSILFTNMIQ
ncbi:MAG: lytic transglycosylase domain-containing protein [Nitrospirota bacterium]